VLETQFAPKEVALALEGSLLGEEIELERYLIQIDEPEEEVGSETRSVSQLPERPPIQTSSCSDA